MSLTFCVVLVSPWLSLWFKLHRLWPATPHNPCICFTFDLLDWAEALMLECQVSLKDFCASLCFKCSYLFEKVRDNN